MMKKLNRRTVLLGAGGISLGMPWLEAMEQKNDKNTRLCFIHMPNGVIPEYWTPKNSKNGLILSKTLSPLEPVKSSISVYGGLKHSHNNGHHPGTATFLSGAKVNKSELKAAESADQVAARHIGQDSYLPSLELAIRPPLTTGKANDGFNKSLGGYISWKDANTPIPRELIPAHAFTRLFSNRNLNTPLFHHKRSILDYIKSDANSLKASIGKEDLNRVDEYLNSLRELERRIQRLDIETNELPENVKAPAPGIPNNFQTHVELMLDIIVLAFRTNRTKVASFMFGRGASPLNFDFLEGVTGGSHHQNSHHNNNQEKINNVEIITRYHITLFTQFLLKLNSIIEGDKSLLDKSLILFGSGLWDGNKHTAKQKPLIVAGRGDSNVQTGLLKTYPEETPFNNLLLGMIKTANCPVEKFGDSSEATI